MAETDTIKSPKGGILLHYGGQCMHVQPFPLLLPAIYIYIYIIEVSIACTVHYNNIIMRMVIEVLEYNSSCWNDNQ